MAFHRSNRVVRGLMAELEEQRDIEAADYDNAQQKHTYRAGVGERVQSV